MKRYDVSMVITPDMQVYKNKPEKKPVLTLDSDFDRGTTYETRLTMNLHTGTHMDFPKHMLQAGAVSDGFDPFSLVRAVKVFDLIGLQEAISAADLKPLGIQAGDFVLFKTRNSMSEQFDFCFVHVDASAARLLADLKVDGVGVDALGIERDQAGYPTHKTLFEAGIIIIEGLRLKDVPAGHYDMIALPLSMAGVEALPLRVVLIDRHE